MQLRISHQDGAAVAQCLPHKRAACSACHVDLTTLNTLAQHLRTIPMGMKEMDPSIQQLKDAGNQRFRSSHYEEAVDAYTKAIQAHLSRPSYLPYMGQEIAVLYSNRSAAECELSHYEEAIADAQECVRIRGDWPKGWFRLGKGMEGMGAYKEAMEAYERAAELGAAGEAKEGWHRCRDALRRQA